MNYMYFIYWLAFHQFIRSSAFLTTYCGFNLSASSHVAPNNLLFNLLCYCPAIFNLCAVSEWSSTNLLLTNQASSLSHLPVPSFAVALCSSATPRAFLPFSESQAPWLFQSLIQSKPSLGLITQAGPVGSYRSRKVPLCFYTTGPLTTGGRDDTMAWMDWCHTSILWSKTRKICNLSWWKQHMFKAKGTKIFILKANLYLVIYFCLMWMLIQLEPKHKLE